MRANSRLTWFRSPGLIHNHTRSQNPASRVLYICLLLLAWRAPLHNKSSPTYCCCCRRCRAVILLDLHVSYKLLPLTWWAPLHILTTVTLEFADNPNPLAAAADYADLIKGVLSVVLIWPDAVLANEVALNSKVIFFSLHQSWWASSFFLSLLALGLVEIDYAGLLRHSSNLIWCDAICYVCWAALMKFYRRIGCDWIGSEVSFCDCLSTAAAAIAAGVTTGHHQEMSLVDLLWWNPAWDWVNRRIWSRISGKTLAAFYRLEEPLVTKYVQFNYMGTLLDHLYTLNECMNEWSTHSSHNRTLA